jgi:hypothetical protein
MNPGLMFMIGGSLLSAGGSAFGGYQAIKQGKYASDILGYQSQYAKALTEIEAAKIDRQAKQTISAQRAQTAASGIRTDVGAPLEIEAETEILADIDKNILRMSGGIESLRYQTAATMARAQGYGQGSAMFAQGAGSLLNTGLDIAQRQGWFAPTKRPVMSQTRALQLVK